MLGSLPLGLPCLMLPRERFLGGCVGLGLTWASGFLSQDDRHQLEAFLKPGLAESLELVLPSNTPHPLVFFPLALTLISGDDRLQVNQTEPTLGDGLSPNTLLDRWQRALSLLTTHPQGLALVEDHLSRFAHNRHDPDLDPLMGGVAITLRCRGDWWTGMALGKPYPQVWPYLPPLLGFYRGLGAIPPRALDPLSRDDRTRWLTLGHHLYQHWQGVMTPS